VVSPTQADYFAKFMPRERIETVLLGVDTDYFVPNHAPKREDVFRCLSGGIWMRDYESLLRTAELVRKNPAIEFHIVSRRFPIPGNLENVFFHENISDAALLELYQTSHTLLLPFKDATANTFLMEGAACGLPVISSQLESIRCYFPGDSSFLINDYDPYRFAECFTALAADRNELARRSALARSRALELSWRTIAGEYQRIYHDLL